MTIQVILLDSTQLDWVNNQNTTNGLKAVVCDYGQGNCISYDVMTLNGYEAFATYFSGVTATQATINTPF